MSAPYDQGMNMPMPNLMDPNYGAYDDSFNAPYPRLSGPPTHFDGVAFWYNPSSAVQGYDRDGSLFSGASASGGPAGAVMEPAGIKHRRTRSGCFTCRSRRVKCDETRPICDRCKKGNRECEFPQGTSSSKRSRHGEQRSLNKDLQTKKETKDENATRLATIKDESDEEDELVSSPTERPRRRPFRSYSGQSPNHSTPSRTLSDTSPVGKDPTSPQSTDLSDDHSRDETPASSHRTGTGSADMAARQAKIRTLKPDLQKYLQFQQESMTYYHYFYKLDPTDFVHSEFIDLALTYEPLLFAVVGFAAYHYELRQPHPKLSNFLGYYSKSLSMLRRALERNARVTEATLLAVLQLATFEEYIGDWVNLVGHHRAAYTMVGELYTPETMMETDLGRRIFSWVARLDVSVGLMGGSATRLDRQWFEANATWYGAQMTSKPESEEEIANTLAYFVSANRLTGMDMAALFAKFAKGEVSVETFHAENAKIVERVDGMKRQIEQFNDENYRVQEFPLEKSRPLTEDDIVNPYVPGGLFKGPLWALNFMWIDWYSIEQLQRYQTAVMLQQPIPRELEQISLEQCRIYEAMERWPDAPKGSILGAHASLGLATVFLKKDARHIMWARHKFAAVERLGYVFPPAFRRKMAEMWGLTTELVGEDESVDGWWLPNHKGNISMLKDIRRVVTERYDSSDVMSTIEGVASVRDLRAIFEKLDVRTQSTQPGKAEGNLSPRSDGSDSVSDRGSSSSFSPTNVSFGDLRVNSGHHDAGQIRRGKPRGLRP